MDLNPEPGTDLEQPADDIRSSLAAALAESEGAPDAATDAAATGGGDAGEAKPERVRGPDGKFLKKEEGDEPAAAAQSNQPDKAAASTDPAATATAVDTKEPPAHWSPADKATFKALPEQGQKFVLDRVKAMEGDYTRKTQEIASFKKEYGPVDEMFAPHKDTLRQKGFTPRTLIESWANVEQKLAAGPDSAVEVIKGLVQGYGIPPEKLAAALGLARQQGAQPQPQPGQQPTAIENGQPVAISPELQQVIDGLRQQVGQFGQKFQTIEQREESNRRAAELQQEQAAESTVNQFRSAKDDKGNLLHPHMEEVEGLMTSLANAALASKQAVPSLQELYETAVYANPSTREQVLTAIRQQEEAKRTEAARAKAANARRAGSSVTGAPGSGQAPSGKSGSELSLRGELEAAVEDSVA